MLSLLKVGSFGSTVRSVQDMLKFLGYKIKTADGWKEIVVDGDFGKNTESAVIDFQSSEGLLRDGIVGPNTMVALERAWTARSLELNSPGVDAVDAMPDRFVFVRLPANKFKDEGYDHLSLRNDIADQYQQIYDTVHDQGGLLTSSGGIRSLSATVNASRSATSMHYLGRALDLYIYSGMVDPSVDACVIVREAARTYRVYVRCDLKNYAQATLPPETTLRDVITYRSRIEGQTVKGHFLDLTQLFQDYGFRPIKARRRFEEGSSMMGAEWWHFQSDQGLISGVTTFGSELLKLYSRQTLVDTPPWRGRDRVFGINWA
ncbi:MAG: peptidoglycan-binding domain-containing protein [Thermodesulfobacteriota bacterium]|nr:peptidoglycan-binding domain-containing protein [Thermodesulfobacteriota bacterium]